MRFSGRISPRRIGLGALLAVLAWGIASLPVLAQDQPSDLSATWKVKNRMQGKLKGGEPGKSEDVSGIACATDSGYPRLCLVVDDETQGAQVVILQQDELIAGDFIRLIDDTAEGKPLELDAEGVAFSDGAFYVIGSHGRPRHEQDAGKESRSNAKAQATRRLFKVEIAPDGVDLAAGTLKTPPKITASTVLADILAKQPLLAPAFDAALADNGLTIEGVAVRHGTVYVGLRGPVLDQRDAVVVTVPLATLFDGAAGAAEIHRLNLGVNTSGRARGIRDLVVFEDGFLLIAGPEIEPKKGPQGAAGDFAIYAWKGDSLTKVEDFPRTGRKLRPEALLPLERKGATLRTLLMFDGGKEGKPKAVSLKLP